MTNLRGTFDKRYIVRDDGTGDSERSERVWCQEIIGRRGTIYPCGFNGDLAAWTSSARIAGRLAKLGIEPLQAGEEWSFRFPPGRIGEVAAVIRAKRRRQLRPEQRAMRAAILARVRNRLGRSAAKADSASQEASSRV